MGRVIGILKKEIRDWKLPIVTEISEKTRDPFRVLVSTILSLRTKDECTAKASERLFALAKTPEDIAGLPEKKIAAAIYPVGFYNTKARRLKQIAAILIEQYGGRAPDDVDELLKLPGVGRKTANLVVTIGYNKPGICVDTHVHRITNRWGYVKTKNPKETEFALREILPEKYWIIINDLLVTYGQNRCAAVSPKCSECPLIKWCKRIGVTRSR
ncbi:endonuclease III [Candidatus Sumerlaeota bacterium]|nr:endonuclease III [Candidatus Sumerlaeota bacterium]